MRAGNSFVVTEPTDKADPDYAKKQKEFEEYQAQAAKEPLAVKLADTVGHNRIAGNFSWTLITGYLVLFMQAGFALLTCGLVRRKNAAPSHDAQLRCVRLRLLGILCVRLRLPVRRRGSECRTDEYRRDPNSDPLSHRRRPVGISGRQRLLPERSGLRRRE